MKQNPSDSRNVFGTVGNKMAAFNSTKSILTNQNQQFDSQGNRISNGTPQNRNGINLAPLNGIANSTMSGGYNGMSTITAN